MCPFHNTLGSAVLVDVSESQSGLVHPSRPSFTQVVLLPMLCHTDSSTLMPLLLSGALLGSTPLAAWADETAAAPAVEAATDSVQQTAAAVTEAAAEAAPAPTWLSYIGEHQDLAWDLLGQALHVPQQDCRTFASSLQQLVQSPIDLRWQTTKVSCASISAAILLVYKADSSSLACRVFFPGRSKEAE